MITYTDADILYHFEVPGEKIEGLIIVKLKSPVTDDCYFPRIGLTFKRMGIFRLCVYDAKERIYNKQPMFNYMNTDLSYGVLTYSYTILKTNKSEVDDILSLAKKECSELYKITTEDIRIESYNLAEQLCSVILSFFLSDTRIYKRFIFDVKIKKFIRLESCN